VPDPNLDRLRDAARHGGNVQPRVGPTRTTPAAREDIGSQLLSDAEEHRTTSLPTRPPMSRTPTVTPFLGKVAMVLGALLFTAAPFGVMYLALGGHTHGDTTAANLLGIPCFIWLVAGVVLTWNALVNLFD
jgi:hypothetical protein